MNPALRRVADIQIGARARGVALGVAAVLLLVLAAQQLLQQSRQVTGATGVRPTSFVAEIPARGGELCQDQVEVPAGTGSLELLTGTFGAPGPGVRVTLRDFGSGRAIARAAVAPGWREGPLKLALTPTIGDRTVAARLCLRSTGGARLAIAGEPVGAFATVRGKPADGRIAVMATSQERRSVAELLPALADRIGRGNASWIGPWTVWAIGLLLVGAFVLGAWAVWRTPGAVRPDEPFVPGAARALVAAALAVGVAWALLTPPFQVPDETSHVAYVQYLSEAGKLPVARPGVAAYSEEQRELLGALGFARVIGRPLEQVATTAEQEASLRDFLRRDLALGGGNATTASANPPLYYLLQAPAYLATARGSLLTQVLAMRLISTLMLAAAVLFAFLFVRELLPGSPWAWTAGGLACAFQPLLGFIGAGVNPDVLLFLSSTVLFFGVARILRHGLTVRRACLVAGALAAGLLTKPLFFALVPVAVAGLGLAAWRERAGALRPLAAATALVVVPVGLVAVVGASAFDHPYFATASTVASGQTTIAAGGESLSRQLSFVWQLFLPRLPFLTDQLPGVPLSDIWIAGLVGVFGWVDYGFGAEARSAGSRFFALLVVLAGVAVLRFRATVLIRWRLGLCLLIGLICVPGVVGVVDYQAFRSSGARFEQARYLLPLLALYAGLFALAFKGLGERLGRLLLPFLWLLVCLHTLAAMILTANRYYL